MAPKPILLRHGGPNPPLALVAAARLRSVLLQAVSVPEMAKDAPPELVLLTGQQLVGAGVALRFLSRVASPAANAPVLYGSDPLVDAEADQWIEFAPEVTSGPGFAATCEFVDGYLATRTFVAGYALSAADVALFGALTAAYGIWMTVRRQRPHLHRWYEHLCASVPALNELATANVPLRAREAAVAAAAAGEPAAEGAAQRPLKGEKGEGGSFDIGLPGAVMGGVVTRFPPEPSGYLHIGHAKAVLLNQYFKDIYKGKLIVRFDDTNPSKEKDEFEASILADLQTLGVVGDRITHTSDYFDDLLVVGETMIKSGLAYVDDTPVEAMRAERMDGIESKHRSAPVANSLALWKEMLAGTPRGFECCVRFKIDMKDPNKAMRDPVAFRCNATPHHRTGSKYKCYPTYDCACPWVDAYEGVTHALRTNEYADRDAQYVWIQKAMGMRHVPIWEYSRLNFVNTTLSKRKLTWFVEQGLVEGWRDPRFPTVQGIVRRGMQVEALKDFILLQGASKNGNLMEWDKLWNMNKRVIDPVCPRHTAVLALGRVQLTLSNGPATPEVIILPRHKKHAAAGEKATTRSRVVWLDAADALAVAVDEEVTLMDWGNAIIRSIDRGADGAVTALGGELHLEGSVKTTKSKLTWLPVNDELVELTLVDFGHLITKKKVEEGDEMKDLVNPRSRWETPAYGDANLRLVKQGDVLQLERKGYYICDAPYIRPGRPMVLLNIPDGHDVPGEKKADNSGSSAKAGSSTKGGAANGGSQPAKK